MSDHTTRHSSEVKTCSKCKQEKPLEQFSRRSVNADGFQGQCKACIAAQGRAWRAANAERKVETHRAWYAANREREAARLRAWLDANRERNAETKRAWKKANPEKVAEYNARQRVRYPARAVARAAVSSAVRHGRIPPARDFTCACGASAEHYHHHNGYAPEHALDVLPVCIACHFALHKEES